MCNVRRMCLGGEIELFELATTSAMTNKAEILGFGVGEKAS